MAIGFQILNKDNDAININDLDVEAAEFFGIPVDDKEYAAPNGPYSGCNWYDTIGWSIAFGKENASWAEVRNFWAEDMNQESETVKKLINLTIHWESKGYTPIRLGYVR